MESLVANSFGRLVTLFLLMVPMSLWLLAVLVNYRGYGARSRARALANGDRWRRTGTDRGRSHYPADLSRCAQEVRELMPDAEQTRCSAWLRSDGDLAVLGIVSWQAFVYLSQVRSPPLTSRPSCKDPAS
jgi:hypothetical protein